jgi:hypothetical protein
VQREQQVPLELLDRLEQPEVLVKREQLEPLELLDRLVQLDQLDRLE